MFALTVSGSVFACTIVAALFGLFLQARLPPDHLNRESKETVYTVLLILGTLVAIVLGLLVASAKQSLESKIDQLRHMAAKTVQLDRTLAEYGSETRETRDLLRTIVESRIRELWQGKGVSEKEVQAKLSQSRGIETIQRQLLNLAPQNDAQRWFRTTALDITNDIAETRWLTLLNTTATIPLPFIVVLTFWLAAIFGSLGVFAPRNGNVMVTLAICALSVASAVFLIIEMDEPFAGFIRVPATVAETALDQLNKP